MAVNVAQDKLLTMRTLDGRDFKRVHKKKKPNKEHHWNEKMAKGIKIWIKMVNKRLTSNLNQLYNKIYGFHDIIINEQIQTVDKNV